ncbi:hypothetical protein CALCODRAFT_537517, partial [Calocera cornea HHB12733]
LRRACPACFALDAWGRDAKRQPDIIVCTDGNRQLRRFRGRSEGAPFYQAELFLSVEEVDAVGEKMASQRTSRSDVEVPGKLSEEARERCKKSFKVADEQAEIVDGHLFDPTGLMVLLCRHDVPLFACDITTPGEQQKYVVALLKALLRELPMHATVGLLYDIGCQLDHSCMKVSTGCQALMHDPLISSGRKYGYLEDHFGRISMGCSVMHAYGHEWACQVVYHPRRREGFGLSDGEGSEQVWSRIRREIPILRRADVRPIVALFLPR